MNPNDFTINITPTYTTIRLNQFFDTEITIEVKIDFFNRTKREKIPLVLSMGKKEYEMEFTKQKNCRIINHQSKIGFANGLQRRDIALKTTKGQIITKTDQLLNVDTSSALKKTLVSGSIIGGFAFFTFYVSIFYFWFFIPISILAAIAITKSKLLDPDNSQSLLLHQYSEEEKLTEESAQRLYNQSLRICDEIKQEKENIKDFIEESYKGTQLQLQVIREQFTEQEKALQTIKTKISEFDVRNKTMESNAEKLKEIDQNLEKTLEKLNNRFNKKLKGLTESFNNALQKATSGLSEQAKANQSTLEKLKTEASNQQEFFQSLKDEMESLPTDFEHEITKLVVEFENLKKELLETPKKKPTEYLSKNDRELLKKLDSSGKTIKSLETQFKDTNGKLQKLEDQFKKGLTAFEKYKNAKSPAEKLFNLESEFRTYSNSVQDALKELNDKVNLFSDLAKQKLEDGEELTKSEAIFALADLKSQISTFETNFTQIKNEFLDLKKTSTSEVSEQYVTTSELHDFKNSILKTVSDLQKTFVDEINALEHKIIKNQPEEKSSDVGRTESQQPFSIGKFLTGLEEEVE